MFHLDHLPGALPGEKTVTILRRHWVTMLPLMASFVVVLCLPAGAYFTLTAISPEFFSEPTRTALFVLGISIFFLYAWLFIFQQFLDWYLDTWIVTTHRILNIEQHGLFARTVAEVRLHRVQDVTAEIHGVLHTLFDYGDVAIQTAGETQRFMFDDVHSPNQVARTILELADQSHHQHSGGEGNDTPKTSPAA